MTRSPLKKFVDRVTEARPMRKSAAKMHPGQVHVVRACNEDDLDSNYLINNLSVADADIQDTVTKNALLDLFRAAYFSEAEWIGYRNPPPFKETSRELEGCREKFLLGRLAGQPAGVISYIREGAWLTVCRLAVAPTFLRRGVASALLRHLIDRESCVPLVVVSTGAANRPAIGCYRRLGFHVERRWATPDGLSMVTLVKAQ